MASSPDLDEKDILNPQDLEELYSWIDAAPISRPKKHIARDFSDGVSVAEIVHFYMPRLVELHNYVNANSTGQKRINWNMLNRKVFTKINLKLTDKIIENVIEAKAGAIEQVLWDLRKKILDLNPKSAQQKATATAANAIKGKTSATAYSEPKSPGKKGAAATPSQSGPAPSTRIPAKNNRDPSPASRSRDRSSERTVSYSAGLKDELAQYDHSVTNDIARGGGTDVNANTDNASLPPAHLIYKGHKMVPSMLLDIKNKQIRDLEVVSNGLQKKVTFLDNLIHLKDNRIEDLSRQLHNMRSKLTDLKLPEV